MVDPLGNDFKGEFYAAGAVSAIPNPPPGKIESLARSGAAIQGLPCIFFLSRFASGRTASWEGIHRASIA
jgi:hypothetical protein